jgi:hypothetical protein
LRYSSDMPLMSSITKFVKSREGRRLTQQAMNYAKSPDAKRQLAQARERLGRRDKQKPH